MMIQHHRQRRPAPRGRVVAMFGAPGAGISTLARVLMDASHKTIAVVNHDEPTGDATSGAGALCENVRAAQQTGADVVLVDAIRCVDDVRAFVAERLDIETVFVHVMNDDAVAALPEVVQHDWHRHRAALEALFHTYSLPYRTIMNVAGDLEAPVGELARVARLRS